MKKTLLLCMLSGITVSLKAQYEGHVGINTPTPSATLHVKSQGSAVTTQSLKIENSAGANLLTINDDGTVSGTAAANLASNTSATPKGSGIFTATAASCSNCHLSPNGNTVVSFPGAPPAGDFYIVAQAVPYNTSLDNLRFSIRATANTTSTNPIIVQLIVNGVATGFSAVIFNNIYSAGQTYIATPSSGSLLLSAGDLIAYRILGLTANQLIGYVSLRYTEQ